MTVFTPEADIVSTSLHLSNAVRMDVSYERGRIMAIEEITHRHSLWRGELAIQMLTKCTNRGYASTNVDPLLTFYRSLSQPIVAGVYCDT